MLSRIALTLAQVIVATSLAASCLADDYDNVVTLVVTDRYGSAVPGVEVSCGGLCPTDGLPIFAEGVVTQDSDSVFTCQTNCAPTARAEIDGEWVEVAGIGDRSSASLVLWQPRVVLREVGDQLEVSWFPEPPQLPWQERLGYMSITVGDAEPRSIVLSESSVTIPLAEIGDTTDPVVQMDVDQSPMRRSVRR